MVCAGCKNLDTKKKVNGDVSGTRYLCKKHKVYVGGDNEICDKFSKADRDTDTYNKLYNEGREWDNDRTSPTTYIVAAIILLIILLFVYFCCPELFPKFFFLN